MRKLLKICLIVPVVLATGISIKVIAGKIHKNKVPVYEVGAIAKVVNCDLKSNFVSEGTDTTVGTVEWDGITNYSVGVRTYYRKNVFSFYKELDSASGKLKATTEKMGKKGVWKFKGEYNVSVQDNDDYTIWIDKVETLTDY